MSTNTMNDSKKHYYVPKQVLFQFEADPGSAVTLDRSWIADSVVLGRLEDGHKIKFAVDSSGQYAVPIPAKNGGTAVLAQLSVTDGDSDEMTNLIVRLSEQILSSDRGLRIQDSMGHTLFVAAVSPNWFSGGSTQTIGTGGPGTVPETTSAFGPTNGKIQFLRFASALNDFSPREKTQTVDIFILDTIPAPPLVSEKGLETGGLLPHVTDPDDRVKFSAHPLGALWVQAPDSPTVVEGVEIISTPGKIEMTRTWANGAQLGALDDYRLDGHDYIMSDHGLFIAGLVKSIALDARIHLIQVLSKYGIGTVTMIADGFARIRQLRETVLCDDAPYLVNCSFTLTTPRFGPPNPQSQNGVKLLDHQALELPPWMKPWLTKSGDIQTQNLLAAIATDALRDTKHAAIIAAAGNDSKAGQPERCLARYPAALAQVLGVGALNLNGGTADYSNYPDAPPTAGLMTLGDLRGLYSEPTHPGPSTGFARWAGTSFATPVITGMLAYAVSKWQMAIDGATELLRTSETGVATAKGGETVSIWQT